MRHVILGGLAALAGVLGACRVGTVETTWHDGGVHVAAKDLNCPAEQVQLIVRKRVDGMRCTDSVAVARGCGKQGEYVCSGKTWTLHGPVVPRDPAPNDPVPAASASAPPTGPDGGV